MASSIFFGTASTVSATGGLTGNGTAGSPLAVNVDGSTITINGSNQLVGAASTPSIITLLTADPGSPSNDTVWIDRIGSSPSQVVALKARIAGSTVVVAQITQ